MPEKQVNEALQRALGRYDGANDNSNYDESKFKSIEQKQDDNKTILNQIHSKVSFIFTITVINLIAEGILLLIYLANALN